MTENNAAQPVLTDDEINAACGRHAADTGWHAENDRKKARAVESAMLSKLRAPVADAPEAFENAWKNRPYLITGDTDKDKARRWWDAGRAAPSVAALAKDPFLAARAWREPTANAPVAGEAPPTDCQNALRIAELPEVDEALAVFCNDGTLDNAVGLVQAILDAAPQVSDGVLPAPCHDLRYHDQYRIGWNRCLDACRAALSAQPAEKPATSAPSPAASQRQAMIPASRESGNSHTDGGAVYG
ncbi:hypothetical protein [Achromobacter animicus]|uniref:hypothetical protein n=1 Tax=Achromobacter animicus TaxID=1389935 RepID=UPI0028AAA42A|nr:hypothetical protein [Achromobacter animicus]